SEHNVRQQVQGYEPMLCQPHAGRVTYRVPPSSHQSSGVSPLISEHPLDGVAAVLIRHCSSVMAA
ncbi:hypothetical protein DPMN_141362, partial [Dreissena polymorpha]